MIKTVYYSDEKNDDFADRKKEDVVIDGSFKYIRTNVFYKIVSFIVYRLIMTPFAFIYSKHKYRLKIVNKEVLKPFKGKGIFLYGNHTLETGDAFIPNVLLFPRKVYVVVKSANISTKGTRNFILMNGAIPLPTKISGMRYFLNAIEKRILEGGAVT
ncbi:MAG: hypothetical protein MJ072_02890, partial [Clostridia bacterium]|nr:hypothetical protein [Clostridia bacterium]